MPQEGHMPETPDPNAPAPEAAPEPKPDPPDEPFDAERAKAAIHKKNQEAESLRKRLKEIEPLAAQAKELEEASKTETQKLTEALAAAKADGDMSKGELLK